MSSGGDLLSLEAASSSLVAGSSIPLVKISTRHVSMKTKPLWWDAAHAPRALSLRAAAVFFACAPLAASAGCLAVADMSSGAYRWLGATATHSKWKDRPALLASLWALCNHHPKLQVLVNFFDEARVDVAQIVRHYTGGNSSQLEGTWVPGMKTLFWKLHLTPERVQHLEVVWVFDCDIAVHPSTFPLGQLAGVLTTSRATVLQPSIQALVHGTYHPWLRVKKAHMSCLATTAQWVEMQTPLFAGDAWAAFHRQVLSIIPHEGLATSDFGLDIIWCAFLRNAFPGRPTCLVTPSFSATHLNSHAIESYMSKEVVTMERSCTTTCKTLFKHFRPYWKNFSHHTGECFSVSGHRGLVRSRSHYAIDGDGMIRARHGHGLGTGLIRGMAAEPPEQETEEALAHTVRGLLRGVGAASLESTDKRLPLLTASLQKLCAAMPGLRIVLNMRDADTSRRSTTGRKADVSLDARISTTWISGARSIFWKRVLTSAYLSEPLDYVWLFDATLAAHPSVNPLAQLVQVLKSTEASVVYGRTRSASSRTRGGESAEATDGNCAASTVRVAELAPSVVFTADGWRHFHNNVLNRFEDDRLVQFEPGFELLVCPLVHQRNFKNNRPACVEAQLWSTRLTDARELAAEVHQRRCPELRCAGPLRRTFRTSFNTTEHDDDRCWAASPRGLTLHRRGSWRSTRGSPRGQG